MLVYLLNDTIKLKEKQINRSYKHVCLYKVLRRHVHLFMEWQQHYPNGWKKTCRKIDNTSWSTCANLPETFDTAHKYRTLYLDQTSWSNLKLNNLAVFIWSTFFNTHSTLCEVFHYTTLRYAVHDNTAVCLSNIDKHLTNMQIPNAVNTQI